MMSPKTLISLLEDFIIKNYDKERLNLYTSINPEYGAARADYFRYLLLYKYGGVYLDIKSGMKKSLNHIIDKDDEYILCHWATKDNAKILGNTLGEFQQWHIISKPKHPFLKAVIKNVEKMLNLLHVNYTRYRYYVVQIWLH